MSFENTQLTQASGYNAKKSMLFGKAKAGTIPGSQFSYIRVPIGTRNPDGTSGELVLPTSRIYSFGLSVNTNMQTGKPDGYSMPLCLQSRDGLTEEERIWIETFNSVVDNCKDHILSIKEEIGKYDLDIAELKKLNPLYYRREKGKIVDGSGPVLYPKVIQQRKKVKGAKNDSSESVITTVFVNEQGDDIDPMSLLEKHCFTTACVKIESIFVGAKISLQVKVQEAEVNIIGGTQKRLLKRPQASSEVVMSSIPVASSQVSELQVKTSSSSTVEDEDEDDGSGVDSDDDKEEKQPVASKPAVTATKTIVRRTAVKK